MVFLNSGTGLPLYTASITCGGIPPFLVCAMSLHCVKNCFISARLMQLPSTVTSCPQRVFVMPPLW